jgi:hypothetical protein
MRMSFFGFGASALVVAACGGGPEPRLVDTLPNDADGGSGGASSVLGSATVATDGGGIFRESGCTAEATNFVYVLSSSEVLYRFAPDRRVFQEIGPLGCQTSMEPNSMAVDRNAVAWVNYFDSSLSRGALYRVSTADGSCLGLAASLSGDWAQVGMGYSVDGPGSTTETLYVASTNGGVLGYLDASGQVQPLGSFTGSLAGKSAELTGTGDGRLFGFFRTTPVEIAQVYESSGGATATTEHALSTVETPSDWAFSFWGGKFYLYTWASGQASTNVNAYDPTSGAVDPSYMTDIGFDIIGAGVSTCAPTSTQPRSAE